MRKKASFGECGVPAWYAELLSPDGNKFIACAEKYDDLIKKIKKKTPKGEVLIYKVTSAYYIKF